MKNPTIPQSLQRLLPFRFRPRHGFALVVTLTLMILLTVIAVGLLTLSGISLRTTSHGNAMSIARANARMALMLALGDLQKQAGPDQRITARADVVDENIANPRLTGVWKSWEIKATAPPSASDYSKNSRDQKFLGWLASSPDGIAQAQVGYAAKTVNEPATLWGTGSLGDKVTAKDIVTAEKVILSPQRGAYAWAVMDEGIKARINTPFVEEATVKAMQTAQPGTALSGNNDGDAFTNLEEYVAGSNPNSTASTPNDLDGDGYSNADETTAGSSPSNPASFPGEIDADGLTDAWETTHFGNVTAQSGTGDAEGDGTNNLAEYRLGLNPNSGASRFTAVITPTAITWQGKAGVTFKVKTSGALNGWTTISTQAGVEGTNTFPITPSGGSNFYQVTLEP